MTEDEAEHKILCVNSLYQAYYSQDTAPLWPIILVASLLIAAGLWLMSI